jgi:hypothetical protein
VNGVFTRESPVRKKTGKRDEKGVFSGSRMSNNKSALSEGNG